MYRRNPTPTTTAIRMRLWKPLNRALISATHRSKRNPRTGVIEVYFLKENPKIPTPDFWNDLARITIIVILEIKKNNSKINRKTYIPYFEGAEHENNT